MHLASESSYETPLASSLWLPLLLTSLETQKNSPKASNVINTEYDYIIVGAGSAGSTIASRLSELPCVTVLLLEAGKEPPLLTEVPAIARSFWFTDIDWQYKTTPQKYTAHGQVNNQIIWPSGKALGGSSILNAMMNVRGNKKDYDAWEAEGAEGWSYKDVLPYFIKLEDNRDPDIAANGYHGIRGPVTIHRPRYEAEIKSSLGESAKIMGYNVVDPNGGNQTGFYDIQGTLRSNQPCSTAKAYLVPAENRTNLIIRTKARVLKVIIRNKRAIGVTLDCEGEIFNVNARREVIMSAGAVNSAQLLMLSGIGPKEELEKFQIPVIADLPVGRNLQDHCATGSYFVVDQSIPKVTEKLTNPESIKEYIQNRSGPLASLEFVTWLAFLQSDTSKLAGDFPNYQLACGEFMANFAKEIFGLKTEVYDKVFGPYENKTGFACFVNMLHPKSRGAITLSSADPYDSPQINPNFLAHPQDIKDIVQGLKTIQRLGITPPMQRVGSRPYKTLYPGCEPYQANEDKYFECVARTVCISLSHPVGTAKMGKPCDSSTVVDKQLKVKNVKGLRVVDASIMPIIPSGNTNIPTIMVAEKASDIIKETIHCCRDCCRDVGSKVLLNN